MRNSVRLLFFVAVKSRLSDVDGIGGRITDDAGGGSQIENLMAVQCKYKFCLLVRILQCYGSSIKSADRRSSSENGGGMGDMYSHPARDRK